MSATLNAAAAPPRTVGRLTLILRQAAFELRLLLRNGEQFLLTILIPAILLIGLTRASLVDVAGTAAGSAERTSLVVPGVLALAVMSTAFTANAITTGFDRRSGALKFLGATPLMRSGLIWAKTLATLAMLALQFTILIALSLALGWRPEGSLVAAAVLILAGTAAFSTLGLALAGSLRAEATLAAANGIYLLLLLGGGVLIPVADLPGPLADIAAVLPSGALGEGLREVLALGEAFPWLRLVTLLGWAGLGAVIAVRTFRWE